MAETRPVHCTECGWQGRRAPTRSPQMPCPKCGGRVSRIYKKRGLPLKAMLQARGRLTEGKPVERKIRTRLDHVLIADICDVVRAGNFASTAAMACGAVPASTFSDWMRRGRSDLKQGNQSVFAKLCQMVETAKAEGEVSLTRMGLTLVEEGKSTWMGCYRHLESYARERWNRSVDVKVSAHHKIEDSIDVAPDPPKTHVEWLRRREERNRKQGLDEADVEFRASDTGLG